MTKKARTLLAEALELPDSERAEIAGSLLRSLEPPQGDSPEEIDAAWREEIRRRVAELESGEAETIPLPLAIWAACSWLTGMAP